MKSFFKPFIVSILSWQAKYVLLRHKPKIVAITGSVGKTSTKDAIFAVLSKKFHVRKSNKSFNSEIGVPLTILGLSNEWSRPLGWIANIIKGFRVMWLQKTYPEWLVLEVGADKPGDIERATSWIKPDIAVITHIGTIPVHVEFFDSIEKLIEEKRHLARALKPGGTLIVDGDDPASLNSRDLLDAGQRTIICGHKAPAEFILSNEGLLYDDRNHVSGMSADILHNEKLTQIRIVGVVGNAALCSPLVAYAVGFHLGVGESVIAEALHGYEPPRGRMRVIEGIKGSVIIDDTYNASPAAMHNALDVLKKIKTNGHKIAVLGDMLELGDYSTDEHYKMGKHVAEVCNYLVVVGMRSRKIAEGAVDAGMSESVIFEYESSKEAGKFAESLIKDASGDVVLVKGSQSIRMEKAVEEIMAHPDNKEKLLVRQEEEWKHR